MLFEKSSGLPTILLHPPQGVGVGLQRVVVVVTGVQQPLEEVVVELRAVEVGGVKEEEKETRMETLMCCSRSRWTARVSGR